MKQLIQNSMVARTKPRQFLAPAVLVVAVFMFTTRAQTASAQGAVVWHVDRDLAGWYYAESPDAEMRLDVILTGQGDFYRINPDGTWTAQIVEPRAPLTVSVRGDGGDWVPVWVGSGSFHTTGLVEPAADGSFDSTGEAEHLHVEGRLTSLLDGSKWSVLVVAETVDYEVKELRIDLQPQ